MLPYCVSRFRTQRQKTLEVKVGDLSLGGSSPIRVQSMLNTPPQDIKSCLKQAIELIEAGCQLVRLAVPNKAAALALKCLREKLNQAGFSHVPLCADIHFLPSVAMLAVEHVEKVRINPGNYADKKKFQMRHYSEEAYQRELERLHQAFSPLVLKAKSLGRALRIGTNHGSLSDRILNHFGDTPEGMYQSALEFVTIAEYHKFKNLVLSMKASNPKVMVQAYRLTAARLRARGTAYPLHLGVTEAGSAMTARLKSTIGIGSLLQDGIGDTIRVSLTENPIRELEVCRELLKLTHDTGGETEPWESPKENLHYYRYARRETAVIAKDTQLPLGQGQPPRVLLPLPLEKTSQNLIKTVLEGRRIHPTLPPEGFFAQVEKSRQLEQIQKLQKTLAFQTHHWIVELPPFLKPDCLLPLLNKSAGCVYLSRTYGKTDTELLKKDLAFHQKHPPLCLAPCLSNEALPSLLPHFKHSQTDRLLFTTQKQNNHGTAAYRTLAASLEATGVNSPIWMRGTHPSLSQNALTFGSLLVDGIGDALCLNGKTPLHTTLEHTYALLQAARARNSKTEYIACPSCGRTLFNLEKVTQSIREATDHLKDTTIAVMGCIVNGLGEMADADFGYVGGARGKINLYVNQHLVQQGIEEDKALEALIELIKKQGKWIENPNLK